MKVNEENVNFTHTTKIEEKKFSCLNLALAIIPACNNSQTNARNVVNVYPGNLRSEFYDFVEKFGDLHWKNLSYVETSHVAGPLRKILKTQIEVDNIPWWLVPVSFLYDNVYWINMDVSYFFWRAVHFLAHSCLSHIFTTTWW